MRFSVSPGTAPGAVCIDGEIDLSVAGDFEQAILAASHEGPPVLDMSRVTFMDSTGLNALIRVAKTRNGTPIVVMNPARAVRLLLDLALPKGIPGLEVRSEEQATWDSQKSPASPTA